MNKKKKGFSKLFVFLFMIILIIFIIFLLCAYVFKLEAKTIVVHNNQIVTDTEIINAIEDNNKKPNFLLTNSSKIKKELKDNEFIKDVKVKKDLLLEIHVYITEKKPLFIREDTNKIVLDDKTEINNNEEYELNIPTLINYVPNKKYSSLIKKITKVDYSIVKKISDIKYDPNKYDEDRFLLYMNDSNKVYINLPKFKNLSRYDKMVEKFEGKQGTLYLDSGNYFKVNK